MTLLSMLDRFEQAGRCTCRPGRDYDGSEFGPCEFCEKENDRENEEFAIRRDAARWRISQVIYPRSMDDPLGYFAIEDDGEYHVGIQPHPVTQSTSINACILGVGASEGAAIDDMFQELDALVAGGACLPEEIEAARILAAEVQS